MRSRNTLNRGAAVILVALIIAVIGTLGAAGRAEAAVPTAITHFVANTNFEQSLESFLTSFISTFFGALQLRNEDFQKTLELGKIEAAREDVNKLVFDTLRELKEGALGGVVIDDPAQARSVLKGLGIQVPPDIHSASLTCPAGAFIGGQCVMVKREGRIITNVDHYLYEEPLQKARDYVNCYYNLLEWRQATNQFATYTKIRLDPQNPAPAVRDSIIHLDLQKANFLASLQRSERGLINAPPVSWYRGGKVSEINWGSITNHAEYDKLYAAPKCDLILRNISCADAAGGCFPVSYLSDIVPINPSEAASDYYDPGAVNELVNPDFPDARTNPAASAEWSWDLVEKSRNPVNTLGGLEQKVAAAAKRIIAEAAEANKAQLVSGQGVRSQTYLVGWPDQWAEADNLRGKYYFVDTGSIISPAFILLDKVKAAIQAEFDLAQKAYKYPPEANVQSTQYRFIGQQGSERKDDLTISSLKPEIDKLPAPFEDFSNYLALPADLYERPGTYAQGPNRPDTKTKTANTNYLNKLFKDVLQLHERSWSDVIASWFGSEADFFASRSRSGARFFRNLGAVRTALDASIGQLEPAVAELEGTANTPDRIRLAQAARDSLSRLQEARDGLEHNDMPAATIYGKIAQADLNLGLVAAGLGSSASQASAINQARQTIGADSAAIQQARNAATREQIDYSLATINQTAVVVGQLPGGGEAGRDLSRAAATLRDADRLIQQGANVGDAQNNLRQQISTSLSLLSNSAAVLNQTGVQTPGAYQAIGRVQSTISAVDRANSYLTDATRIQTLIASGDPLTLLTGISQGLNLFNSASSFFQSFFGAP
ncbi:hypothetical protein HYZ80_03945 [Candidatus Parcubacteria bacterium]|nr:hypothetical protein [Candidatus Parcubacteria bacterium]